MPDRVVHHGTDDELCDLVAIGTVLAAISAAAEAISQYQSWQESRQNLQRLSELPDTTFAAIRRDLLRVADLMKQANQSLAYIDEQLGVALSLIRDADDKVLDQIPFLQGYKARVRFRDRPRYRESVGEVVRGLEVLLRTLDEAAETVARIMPSVTRGDLIHAARASATEHQAISQALTIIAQSDTSYGAAVDVVRRLMETARGYLVVLQNEAFGLAESRAVPGDQEQATT